jgi:predicted transcriptional regulator
MDIVRVIKSKDYTTICNRIFKDRRLSLKAKGLLAMLLSFSDSWKLSISGLEAILKEGKASIRTTMNELIKCGYVEREQIREDGMFLGVDYTVFESPKCDFRKSVFPTSDNQTQVSNNIINNQSNKDNSKIKFFDEVMAFDNYSKEMLNDFFEYWSEPTKKGVLKKDTMKTWSTSRRLKTWAKNESKWALNSVGISKVDKHLQSHNEAMQILKQIQENDKKNK